MRVLRVLAVLLSDYRHCKVKGSDINTTQKLFLTVYFFMMALCPLFLFPLSCDITLNS